MSDIYNIKGTVYDDEGNPAGNRKVFVLNRETANLERTLYSNQVTGEFSTNIDQNSQYMVICMPSESDTSNAKIYDRITPTFLRAEMNVNKIGVPGTLGFGVGVCPNLPSYMFGLEGYDDIQSPNYGNYQVALDGSIMVWVPAFYYKYGTGTNGLEVNQVDIKDLSDYGTPEEAALEGFALHRAFIDGGQIKQGFFVDKYQCSMNPNMVVASSLPLSSIVWTAGLINQFNLGTATIRAFVGMPKSRGADFFCTSAFIYAAISMLSIAHSFASQSTLNCAWYTSDKYLNFPKGRNNSSSTNYNYFDTSIRAFIDYSLSAYTLSGGYNVPEKATHNGMKSGISDISGNGDEISIGVQRISGSTSPWYVVSESFIMKNATSTGTTPETDVLQTSITPFEATSIVHPNVIQHVKKDVQMFHESTERTSDNYKRTSFGMVLGTALDSSAVNKYNIGCFPGFSANAAGGTPTYTGNPSNNENTVIGIVGINPQGPTAAGASNSFRCSLYLD